MIKLLAIYTFRPCMHKTRPGKVSMMKEDIDLIIAERKLIFSSVSIQHCDYYNEANTLSVLKS